MSSLTMQSSKRIRMSFPFIVGIGVFCLIVWGLMLAINYPYEGITSLSTHNEILSLDEHLKEISPLKVGDIILEVNNQKILENLPSYSWYLGKKAGDSASFLIQRGQEKISVTVPLARPSGDELVTRLMPLFIALVFLIVGLGVEAFAPVTVATELGFWFFLFSSLLLTSGQLSWTGPTLFIQVYNFLWWVIGPLAVHFHLFFPQEAKFKGRNILLLLLYFIGLIGGILNIIWGNHANPNSQFIFLVITASRYFLATNLLFLAALLYYHYHNAVDPGVRAKIRLLLLGGLLSVVPFVTFYILPEILINKPIIPHSFTFIWISFLPLTYGYAIFRYRIIEFERHVNRGATVLLVFSILVGIYISIFSLLERILPSHILYDPALNTFIILSLSASILPISKRVQRLVDTMFYGGWYDYRSAILQITSNLEQITDLRELASVVAERLTSTLRIEDACIFLSDIEGDFSVVEVAPKNKLLEKAAEKNLILPRSSLEFLLKVGGEEKTSLAEALRAAQISPEEYQLLNTEQEHLWVPIIGHGQIKGLLALGQKYGGDVFSAEDLDILRVVARTLGPIIENIHLLNQLRKYASELEKRVEERTAQLYDAKERVEAILRSVGDGVVVTNLDGVIETVNDTMLSQSSYTMEELVGLNYLEWLGHYNDEEIIQSIKNDLQKGLIWTGELIHARKNGKQYDISLTIAPVRDQKGNIINFVATQRDITYRKELDRIKDIFVADVSHELRTPTTNITLYLELLEGANDSKRAEYLRVLKEQTLLLRRLVEDILDLSRLAIGKTKKIEFTPVDLNLIIEQSITAYIPSAAMKGIDLQFEKNPGLPFVRGETNQISRVVNNLIGNAINYTNQGFIRIRAFQLDRWVCFEVKDSGIGIAEEDLPHIFERFYRGQQVRQTKKHGTGLGLAIVNEIVDVHGGRIEVESQENQGSTFRVYLPIWEA